MNKRNGSIFQPGHDGKHNQVPVHPGMTVSHVNHTPGRQIEHDASAARGVAQAARTDRKNAGPIDPRVGSVPKHQQVVPVAAGMHRQVNGKPVVGSGNFHSALDALSGAMVPAGKNVSTPSWGNGGVQNISHPPGSKKLAPVKPSWNMRGSGLAAPDDKLSELGSAILDAAFSTGSPDDKAAHGRGQDGRKLPLVVNYGKQTS